MKKTPFKSVKKKTTALILGLVLISQIAFAQNPVQTTAGATTANFIPVFGNVSGNPSYIKNSQIVDNNGVNVIISNTGANTPLAGEYFGVRGTVNNYFLSRFYNSSDGALAYSQVAATVGTSSMYSIGITMASSNYGTTGMLAPNVGILNTNGAGGMHVGTTANAQLSFWTNNTKKMTITNSGLVGIGTASPSAALEITQPSGSTLRFYGNATGDISSSTSISAHYGATNSTDNYSIYQGVPGSGIQRFYMSKAGLSYFRTSDATTGNSAFMIVNDQNLTNTSGGNQVFKISNDGSTTINDPYGTANIPLTIQKLNGSTLKFYANAFGDYSSTVALRPHFATGSDYSIYEGTTITGSDQLRFKVSAGGNVGIGTASPTEKLHVEGGAVYINSTSSSTSPLVIKGPTPFSGDNRYLEIKPNGATYVREIYVQTTAFPDYVFAKDYKLMPLTEVATYIADNKHLPNVPCEKEVVTNGQNVGQIQVAQMEKIEEMYLYLIEMNGKLQKLENENAELKKQVETLKK